MSATLSPIALSVVINGGPQVSRTMRGIGDDAQTSATKVKAAYATIASAWSPAIAAQKKFQAEQRAAAQGARDAARQIAQAARSAADAQIRADKAAADSARSAARVRAQAARDAAKAQQDAAQAASSRQAAMQTVLGDARNVGLGMTAAGAAIGAGGVFSLQAAGQMQRVRMGFKTTLGSDEAAERMMQDINAYDQRSPWNFLESAKSAQTMLAMGFKQNEIIPMMDALGDAVAAGGGGTEQFKNAAVALAQIKTLGKVEMDELRQLAEGGKIPVFDILREAIGQKRLAKIMSGDEKMMADEALPILIRGMKEKAPDGMKNAMNTIPGQIEQLSGALFKLAAVMGQHLAPPVMLVTGLLTSLANWLANLPAPLQAAIAYGAAFVAGLLVLIGTLVTIAAVAGSAVIGFTAFQGALGTLGITTGVVTTATQGLAATITGTLLPALGLAVAGLAGVALGFAVFSQIGGDLKTALRPNEYRQAHESVQKVLGDPNSTKEQKIAAAKWAIENFSDYDKGGIEEQSARRIYKDLTGKDYSKGSPEMDAIQAQIAGLKINPTVANFAGAAPTSSIEALEDRLANTEDKDERKKIAEQLRLARRAAKHERATDREQQADRMEAARAQNAAEKSGLEERIRLQEDSLKQRIRAEEDSTKQQLRQLEDTHKRTRDADLRSVRGMINALRAGFSHQQIELAQRIQKAAAREAKKDGSGDQTAVQRRMEDIREASQRRIEDMRDAAQRENQDLRSGARSAASALLTNVRRKRGPFGSGGLVNFAGSGVGRGGNGLPEDDEYYSQRGMDPDKVRLSLRQKAQRSLGRGLLEILVEGRVIVDTAMGTANRETRALQR